MHSLLLAEMGTDYHEIAVGFLQIYGADTEYVHAG